MAGDRLDINHWDADPKLWQVLRINDWDAPGVAQVECTIGRKLDDKSAGGSDGGTITDKGYTLAPVRVTLKIWTAQHWADMQDLLDKLQARRNLAQRDPVSMFHPAIACLGVEKVVLKDMGSPRPSSTPGAYEVTFNFLEYNPPPRSASSRTRRPSGTAEMNFTEAEAEGRNPNERPTDDFGAGDPDVG